VRNGLFDRMTGGDALTSLLAAMQSEPRRRHQPLGQNSEGLVARPANPTPYPDLFVTVVMRLPKPASVTDNRVTSAKWAPPRQEVQRDHPGSGLAFGSGNAMKRITAGCWSLRGTNYRRARDFTLRQNQCRTKKEYYILRYRQGNDGSVAGSPTN
jgi:hypothetical protein